MVSGSFLFDFWKVGGNMFRVMLPVAERKHQHENGNFKPKVGIASRNSTQSHTFILPVVPNRGVGVCLLWRPGTRLSVSRIVRTRRCDLACLRRGACLSVAHPSATLADASRMPVLGRPRGQPNNIQNVNRQYGVHERKHLRDGGVCLADHPVMRRSGTFRPDT